jgi:hypothetical protein
MAIFATSVRKVYQWLGADFAAPTSNDALPDGRFPSTKESMLWDLLPSRMAPDLDGLVAPSRLHTDWINTLNSDSLELQLSVAQAARLARQTSVDATEAKASRLLTPTVTLVVASAALAAYQLKKAGEASAPLLAAIAVLPAAAAVMFFTVSALRSLDTDIRIGFYKFAQVRDTSAHDREDYLREAITYEVLGAYWAKWTAAQKKNALMQARAWFSRGVIFLVLGLVIGAATQIFTSSSQSDGSSVKIIYVGPTSSPTPTHPAPLRSSNRATVSPSPSTS